MTIKQVLLEKFGYDSFRPGQQEIIEAILEGNDVIGLLPTGMGKSLCYQLPAYMMNGPVLIISPLLSLMQDQVDQLKKFGEKRVVAFNSFLTQDQKQYALHFLHEYRFIFASPEMLAQPNLQERFREIDFSMIVVDEAHCISQWGFDFRPDYLRLKDFIQSIRRVPILALTATATDEVLNDIEAYLSMDNPFKYIHSIDRPNIKLVKKEFLRRNDKKQWIVEHLETTAGPGIVYMQSRNRANELAKELAHNGLAVAAYHGGMENEDRQFIQQQFINGNLDWIIATNAFGMGVHKNDIRQVVHETMPGNIANYMQEIGRAGRDGELAVATLLYAPGDEETALFIATEDVPNEQQLVGMLAVNLPKYNAEIHFKEYRISETIFRVLNYWLSVENQEQVKLRLQQIRQKKLQQVNEMVSLVQTEGCIRKQKLAYFGQILTEVHEQCCSNCRLNEELLWMPRQIRYEEVKRETWMEKLQILIK